MDRYDDMDLAARVRFAREAAGLGKKELADLVPCSPSAVTQWENGSTQTLKGAKLIGLARATGFLAAWLETGLLPRRAADSPAQNQIPGALPVAAWSGDDARYASVARVHFKLSAGVSGFNVDIDDDATVPPIVFQKEWFQAKGYDPAALYAVKVSGASMEPSLWDGDLVVINTNDTAPRDGEVFAVNFEGEMVIKRLRREAGEWWATSDNIDQRRYAPKRCNGSVLILGRIVYRQSERI